MKNFIGFTSTARYGKIEGISLQAVNYRIDMGIVDAIKIGKYWRIIVYDNMSPQLLKENNYVRSS